MNEARDDDDLPPGGFGYDVDTYGTDPFDRNEVLKLLGKAEMTLKRLTKEIDVAASGGLVETGFFPNEFSERLEKGFNKVQANLSTLQRDLAHLHRDAKAELK